MKMNVERLSTSLLLLLLAAQVALALRPPSGPFGGDEPYYVSKAEYFATHHRFPRAAPDELAVENGRQWGTSDWRPQGYPLFVALCSGGSFAPARLRPRVTAVQVLLIALAIFLVFKELRRLPVRPEVRIVSALVLGLAPWPFEFVGLIGPDSLVASVTAISLLLIGRWPKSVFFATMLFTTTFTFRPEMIVLPPLIVGVAALFQERHRIRFIMAGATAFFVIFAIHYAYRMDFTGQTVPTIFGGLHIQDRGAFSWVNTWIGTEHEAYDFVFSLTNGMPTPRLPDRAFANEIERQKVDGILAHIRTSKRFSAVDDAAFDALARSRVSQHPLIVFSAHVAHIGHLWINEETNSQLLQAFVRVPRNLRRPILGGLLILKLTMLAGFGVFLVRIRSFRGNLFLVLCALYVVARTALVGFALGWFAHRYVVNAWIPLIVCAVTALTYSLPPPDAKSGLSDGFASVRT